MQSLSGIWEERYGKPKPMTSKRRKNKNNNNIPDGAEAEPICELVSSCLKVRISHQLSNH